MALEGIESRKAGACPNHDRLCQLLISLSNQSWQEAVDMKGPFNVMKKILQPQDYSVDRHRLQL